MVPCEAIFSLVRKRAAWNIVLKEKAASCSMKGHCSCPRDPMDTYKHRAACFLENSLQCVCSLSAPYMTLRKKRWEGEVIGQSPLGYADPFPALQETPLSWKVAVKLSKETLGCETQKALHKLSETQPFIDLRDHSVFLANLQLDCLFEMVSSLSLG